MRAVASTLKAGKARRSPFAGPKKKGSVLRRSPVEDRTAVLRFLFGHMLVVVVLGLRRFHRAWRDADAANFGVALDDGRDAHRRPAKLRAFTTDISFSRRAGEHCAAQQ